MKLNSDKQPWSTFLHNITSKNNKLEVEEDAIWFKDIANLGYSGSQHGGHDPHTGLQNKSEGLQMIKKIGNLKKQTYL